MGQTVEKIVQAPAPVIMETIAPAPVISMPAPVIETIAPMPMPITTMAAPVVETIAPMPMPMAAPVMAAPMPVTTMAAPMPMTTMAAPMTTVGAPMMGTGSYGLSPTIF